VHNGHSRSSKVIDIYTNRKLSINFLLVINSNFGHILHRFRDIASQRSKNRFCPTYPALRLPLRGTPSEFLDETYPVETRGMGLLYGENCIILTSNTFDWSTRVTDRQTDGQMELRWHIRAIAYMLSRVKTQLLLLQPFYGPWIVSKTTQVSRYLKGKTRKVKPWIYWSKR